MKKKEERRKKKEEGEEEEGVFNRVYVYGVRGGGSRVNNSV